MAGALGVRLSGPRRYDGRVSPEPWVNGTGTDPRAVHMRAALDMTVTCCLLLGGTLLLLAGGAWVLGW